MAGAHQPRFGDYYAIDEAYPVADPAVSIVVYKEVTCDSPQLWLALDPPDGFAAYVQLGVPQIDRLADYRPSLAVIAPGLPAPTEPLPFALPEGTGVVVLPAADTPTPFDEPFTQTSSWIWVEQTVELPQGGPAWLVAWDPSRRTGKLWVPTGTVEDFSTADVSDFVGWNRDVNAFHETARFEPADPEPQVTCVMADPVTEPAVDAVSDLSAGGCATSNRVVGGGWLVGGVGLLGLRRRRG